MQTDDLVVRGKVLDGTWETIGADRSMGIVPENFVASSNQWGPDKASFDLRRNPGWMWPDLSAFTDIDVEVGGEPDWSGRISETPSRDGDDPVINVQCEGWQYHLDDDVYAKNYVHSRLADWRDYRSYPDAVLTYATAGYTVDVSGGQIRLALPNGAITAITKAAAAVLDLGPYSTAKRIVATYTSGAHASFDLSFGVSDTPGGTVTWTVVDAAPIAATGTGAVTFATAKRYVHIRMESTAAVTGNDSSWVALQAVSVFADTAYESGNASILKASTVVADAKTQAAPLLSTDVSKIATTSFSIPDLRFELAPRTPREVIEGVNAFHNYLAQVDVEKRLVFGPRPSAPLFEVGSWGGSTFEDSAMNSGQDVYNRVLVTGTGPDGGPLLAARGAPITAAISIVPVVSPALTEPSFTGGTTGWTGANRDTVTFDTAPAGVSQGNGEVMYSTYSGTFLAYKTYVHQFRAKWTTSAGTLTVELKNSAGTVLASAIFALTSSWETYSLSWLPSADLIGVQIWLTPRDAVTTNIDTFKLGIATPTIVDRRGFRRTKILPVSAALTTTVANQIGDTYLAAHRTQPLKGQLVVGKGGVRMVQSGETVHPARLLRHTGQLVRLGHRVDPDTGGLGRDGTIASVTYNHNERTSTVVLDNDRRNFEALLARFAAISPQ